MNERDEPEYVTESWPAVLMGAAAIVLTIYLLLWIAAL